MLEVGDIVRIGYRDEMRRWPPLYGINDDMLQHCGECLVISDVEFNYYHETNEFKLQGGGRWSWSLDMFTHYAKDGDNRLIPLR